MSIKNKDRNSFIVLIVLSLLMMFFSYSNAYSSQIFSRMIIAGCMAGGLDICVGISGQLSLGHAIFMGTGAYACASLCKIFSGFFGIVTGILFGVVCAMILALILGYAILKLKGDYLAVSTLGAGEIFRIFMENCEPLGGAGGLYNIPKFTSPFISFVVLICCIVVGIYFKSSRIGFLAKTVGQDEEASMSIGVDVHKNKIFAFVLSAGMVAVAGALYAGLLGFISPRDFSYSRSVDILAAVIIGGTGTIYGPMIAAMLIEGFFSFFKTGSIIRMIIYSIALIIITIRRYRIKNKIIL